MSRFQPIRPESRPFLMFDGWSFTSSKPTYRNNLPAGFLTVMNDCSLVSATIWKVGLTWWVFYMQEKLFDRLNIMLRDFEHISPVMSFAWGLPKRIHGTVYTVWCTHVGQVVLYMLQLICGGFFFYILTLLNQAGLINIHVNLLF